MHLPCRFGRYTLLEKVACGGTAEVFRAVLAQEGGFAKTVAIKRLLPSWSDNEELRRMLVDEARVLCLLSHPAIVQVHELGSEAGEPFLAMEFVEGMDAGRLLTHAIREAEPVPIPIALALMGQVLAALAFAHATADADGRLLGIVHRDVTPSNILLSWNGEVKVTDFGIAKGSHRTELTAAGQLRGKYAYMAPEQARGERIDARADLYACGIVLYELLTARRLYAAATEVELVRRVAHADATLSGIEALAAEVRAILLLALSARPETRFQSAAEMQTDVRRAARAAGEPCSSLEIAAYLRERFPDALERRPATMEPAPEAAATTCVMGPCFLPADPAERPGPPSRRAMVRRAAAVLIAIAVFAAIPPTRVSADRSAAVSPADATVQFPAERAAAVPAATLPLPPPRRGAVILDSRPPGARGVLTLGGQQRRIVTPFALEGIELGQGLEGRIALDAPGFVSVAERFHLGPSHAAFVKTFTLRKEGASSISVNARPWGLATVAGVVQGRETPLSGAKIAPGTHEVSVVYPPSGQALQTRVRVGEGQSARCMANFESRPAISCSVSGQ